MAYSGAKLRAYMAARRNRGRVIRDAAKAAGCADCGLTEKRRLHFHHRDGHRTKVNNVGWMIGYSTASLIAEIAKCDVLCGSCHIRRHIRIKLTDEEYEMAEQVFHAGSWPSIEDMFKDIFLRELNRRHRKLNHNPPASSRGRDRGRQGGGAQ